MLTHGNLLSNAEATAGCAGSSQADVLLSWLPYSHIYARTCDLYVTTLSGATLCLAESADTLLVNLAEIQPTDFTSVPRFYEKVWAAVEALPLAERAAQAPADLRPERPPALLGRRPVAQARRGGLRRGRFAACSKGMA